VMEPGERLTSSDVVVRPLRRPDRERTMPHIPGGNEPYRGRGDQSGPGAPRVSGQRPTRMPNPPLPGRGGAPYNPGNPGAPGAGRTGQQEQQRPGYDQPGYNQPGYNPRGGAPGHQQGTVPPYGPYAPYDPYTGYPAGPQEQRPGGAPE